MNIKALIARHEGLRLKPYKDTVGKLTIGYGRNLDDIGITIEEALMLLESDIMNSQKSANTFKWFKGLDEVRQSVVIDMIFNLGLTGFKKFRKTIGLASSIIMLLLKCSTPNGLNRSANELSPSHT